MTDNKSKVDKQRDLWTGIDFFKLYPACINRVKHFVIGTIYLYNSPNAEIDSIVGKFLQSFKLVTV